MGINYKWRWVLLFMIIVVANLILNNYYHLSSGYLLWRETGFSSRNTAANLSIITSLTKDAEFVIPSIINSYKLRGQGIELWLFLFYWKDYELTYKTHQLLVDLGVRVNLVKLSWDKYKGFNPNRLTAYSRILLPSFFSGTNNARIQVIDADAVICNIDRHKQLMLGTKNDHIYYYMMYPQKTFKCVNGNLSRVYLLGLTTTIRVWKLISRLVASIHILLRMLDIHILTTQNHINLVEHRGGLSGILFVILG